MSFWPFYIKTASAHLGGIIGHCRHNEWGLAHTFPAGQIARRRSTDSAGPNKDSFLIIPNAVIALYSQFQNTPTQQPLTQRSFTQPPVIMALPYCLDCHLLRSTAPRYSLPTGPLPTALLHSSPLRSFGHACTHGHQ